MQILAHAFTGKMNPIWASIAATAGLLIMKHLQTTDFDVEDRGGSVEVLFRPTRSHYSFYRLALDGRISPTRPIVRHAVAGSTADYEFATIEEAAREVAVAAVQDEMRQ